MRNVAIIPAKARSTRVPNKNFRPFYDQQSLLDIKIEQCIQSGLFSEVYVSSNCEEAKISCDKIGARYLARDESLCGDDSPWSAVIEGVLRSVPEIEDTFIAWCPTTSPLFTNFRDAIGQVQSEAYSDSVMTVTRLKHYYLNSDYIPFNFQFGVWASYSQKLPHIFQMNCAMWGATKGAMIKNRFQIGDKPTYFETSVIEGTDIDTMEEFEIAALLYARAQSKLNLRAEPG